ncbi:4326_t:CDS:1 [Paraglomus brasilianum]|uniref:4326_t:CDS:1 n=1 Tax=Paraglomus brasilianum TaxID=144538 RepID=A0A9N8ZWZ8_9GLOM|nr:4326_t:CDS:1 [Paraglomus brasilianum]
MTPPVISSDVVQIILSHLPVRNIYALRRVNREWYSVFEHALMLHLLEWQSQIIVKPGANATPADSIALTCVAYDPPSGVFTFKPTIKSQSISCVPKYLRQLKILFQEWDQELESLTQKIRRNEPGRSAESVEPGSEIAQHLSNYALALLVERYVDSSMKEYQIYEKPGEETITYLGDEDMILKCYTRPVEAKLLSVNPEKTVALEIEYMKVRSSWIVSGTSNQNAAIPRFQIYPERYILLSELTAEAGISDYNHYASAVLQWVTSDHSKLDQETTDLLQRLKDTKGDFTKSEKLAKELEARGITRRCMWQHGFSRRFISGLDNSMTFEQVLERIVNSEKQLENRDTNQKPMVTAKPPARFFDWKFGKSS